MLPTTDGELPLDASARPWLIGLGLRSGWANMPARKIDWLMGLRFRSGGTDVSAGKIDWLMGLASTSKCDVSTGRLSSGTSGNSLSILSTSFRISSQMTISFSCTDYWYGSLSFLFKPESLPTDIWKKKTIHVSCMDKQSQNIHILLIWDFERHAPLRKWSKPRKFMSLKYVKKQKD